MRVSRRQLPDVTYLRECFLYNKRTGVLLWKRRPDRHFSTSRSANTWNTSYSGKPALTFKNKSGHANGNVAGRVYLAHRIIWKLVTGEEPPPIVDHKDRNPGNNRWSNLRVASKGQNNINSGIPHGVFYQKARGTWMAHIKVNQKRLYLGTYSSEDLARIARRAAEVQYFGKFAPQ